MTCGLAQVFVWSHRHHANGHQGSAPRRIRFTDCMMGNPKSDEPALEFLEVGFVFYSQGNGMRSRWEPPWGALSRSMNELRG